MAEVEVVESKVEEISEIDKRIAEEYLRHFNNSQAYRAVHPNVSKETAWSAGASVIGKSSVQAYLAKRQAELIKFVEEHTGITKARVVERNATIALSNLIDYIDIEASKKNGYTTYKRSWELTRQQMEAVEKFVMRESVRKNRRVKQEVPVLRNPEEALKTISKHFGLIKELGTSENPIYLRWMEAFVNLPPKELENLYQSVSHYAQSSKN